MRLNYAQIAQATAALRWGGPAEIRWSDAEPWPEVSLRKNARTHLPGVGLLVELPQALGHLWNQAKHLLTGGRWDDRPEYDPGVIEWYERMDSRWQRRRREAVRDQDQALVNLWRAEGWLLGEVRVHLAGPLRASCGCVWIGSRPDQVHDVMLNIRPSGDLPHLTENPYDIATVPLLNQWLTLAHEAAHTVFAGECFPFQPSPEALNRLGVMPERAAAQVHDWNVKLFSMGALGSFCRQLDEAFADVYGAMMVLASTDFHPQAIREVELRQQLREADIQQPLPRWSASAEFDLYEVTSPALQRLLETRTVWAKGTPDEQRQHALRLVSDAWLSVAARHTQVESDWVNEMDWSLSTHTVFHEQMLRAFDEGPAGPEAALAYYADMSETIGHQLWTKWLKMWRRSDQAATLDMPEAGAHRSLREIDGRDNPRRSTIQEFVDPWMDRWLLVKKGQRAKEAWRASAQALKSALVGYQAHFSSPPLSPPKVRRSSRP